MAIITQKSTIDHFFSTAHDEKLVIYKTIMCYLEHLIKLFGYTFREFSTTIFYLYYQKKNQFSMLVSFDKKKIHTIQPRLYT